jgi:hypothetical protein
MSYKIFIAYAREDDQLATLIHNCLAKINEFIPYKAEIYQEFGDNFKQRLERELSQSFAMVVLLTENGMNSQWVNQEIGYAYALKKRGWAQANLPHIIPISYGSVQLKAFITKDSIDILFLDKYSFVEAAMADIISQIRLRIPRGLEGNSLHCRITCFNCFDEKGFEYEYFGLLPSAQDVTKAIQSGRHIFSYTCPKCHSPNNVDIRTFESIK